MASNTLDESQENACVVCFKGVEIYSVGQCDHPVCYECSTRMRVLCRQNECPICRQDMPKVIFTKSVQPYNSLQHINGLIDKKFKVVFETESEKKAYDKLLAHECPKCTKVFTTFVYLRDHVRRVHQLNYCDLCVDNLKIYSRERRCYNRAELGQHRKDGDPDDRSHRGHPLCEFCDTRYMDTDELYRHLRRDHLYCHFCDADGLHQYYSSYDFLRDHFRSEHYLCEEGDCINEKFTAVFRTEIDLKAHRTTVHGRGLGKAGLKQARTLELEFTLAPRPRPPHNRLPRYREEEFGVEPVGAIGGEEDGRRIAPELRREEDFPALSNDTPATSLSLRLTSAKQPTVSIHTSIQVSHPRFTTKVGSENSYNHHFPALGRNGGEGHVASVSWSGGGGGGGGSGVRRIDGRAPPGLSHPEDFPSLSGGRTAVGTQSDLPDSRPPPLPDPHQRPAPPPPDPRQPPSLPAPSKTKKKKSKSKGSGPPPVDSTPSSLTSGESKSKKNKKEAKTASPKKEKEPHQLNNNFDTINNNNVENIIKAMSIISKKEKNTESSHTSRVPIQADEFPSLNAPPGFSGIAPTPLSIPPPEAAVPLWKVKKLPKPPPGLGKPPPGLPPPGFTGLNGGFPPLIDDLSEDGPSESSYITPNNFAKRNASLVKQINSSLVGETLEEFKQISAAYRNGSLAAPEYYAHCRDMLGPANFRELFPELLALLPDIEKQQELWQTFRLDKHFSEGLSSAKKKTPKVEACATCGQIVRTSDLRDHLARHTLFAAPTPHTQLNPWAKLNF